MTDAPTIASGKEQFPSSTMDRQTSESSEGASSMPRIPKKKKITPADTQENTDSATSNSEPIKAASTSNEGGDDKKKTKEGKTPTTGQKKAAKDSEGETPSIKAGRPSKSKAAAGILKRPSSSKISSQTFDPPILRKGDLVRLSNEQKSGRIQGGLARVTRANFHPDDTNRTGEPLSYDIDYVLGGKVSNLERCDLSYTTATAEGLVDATDSSRGHLLRRRRAAASPAVSETQKEQEKEAKSAKGGKKKGLKRGSSVSSADGDTPTKRKGPGRPTKKSAKSKSDQDPEESSSKRKSDAASAAASKKRRGSKASDAESETAYDKKSQAAKLGWEKRRAQQQEAAAAAAAKSASKSKGAGKAASKPASKSAGKSTSSKSSSGKASSKRGSKRNSATDLSECSDAGTSNAADDSTAGGDTTDAGGSNKSRRMDIYTKHRREMEKSLSRLEKLDRFGFFLDTPPPEFDECYEDGEAAADGDELERDVDGRPKAVQFPEQPPFNFLVIRKRLAAGRYDLDMVALEQKRLSEIRAMLNSSTTPQKDRRDDDISYEDLARSMINPIAIDWETLNADVIAMCDAAMARDPDGISLGNGHLGFSASKIKKLMEEIYGIYGSKRLLEVEESEARARYDRVLMECGNVEAAMQGEWRREAFPERKYERLETSSVICDGLSPKDRSYAMYELETKLPDSFVGLAYTYDDSGQHSETWMKTVADETQSSTRSKSKSKRKKKDSTNEEADSLSTSKASETKAQKAAMALAKDESVVRAQVQTTMTTMLIQVQDRVMTDLGVMHAPEARSANWDDGDSHRDYRGSAAEVEQGTHSGFSLSEVAEQEVWGIDCYTRKNVMTLIEQEFNSEIAIEFVEKWLLPAINACPVNLAHKMSTATRILEGLPLVEEPVEGATKDVCASTSVASDMVNTRQTSKEADNAAGIDDDNSQNLHQESCVFLRNAMESKIKEHAPPWLRHAARIVRLAADSLDDDFFRIHPKGHGSVVIGERGLKANSLVTYYRGEVYPAWRWCEKLDAIEHVQKRLNLRPNLPDFYNMAMERPKKDPRGYCLLFVDASRKSGLGSSFSHSCNPTCEVRVVSLNGKLSLSMTTLRDLEQGEELTFDYNAVTESVNEYRFAVCLCGQKNCRGSFLHFATADCYQQVLSRNSPISARFANLVRGCMKQVMSKEDSELLLKHGFNTAAFGAVSFNHHVTEHGNDGEASPDSIENVPVWLRTFVADCLRYIEYERRALPVALLCNQMERLEKKQKGKSKANKASLSKKERKQVDRSNSNAGSSSEKSKSKAITGSRPVTSYFFFLQSQRKKWEALAVQKHGNELKGLEFSQAVNKEASKAWSELGEEEKRAWKKKSIADWKKNGGKEKARLEEERQKALDNESKALIAQNDDNDGAETGDSSSSAVDENIEAKTISFADADAEGFSAMEQRIQQLAQSLSRIGRVLDRHRESVFAEKQVTSRDGDVDSDLLRELVPSPLKIMTDTEVVGFLWSSPKGVVRSLFSMVELHFPNQSLLLRELLASTEKGFPVLSAFSQLGSVVPNLDKKWKHSCTSIDARRLVREALLKLRENIIDFLSFAEKSNAEARNEKRREQARAREEKKKKEQQQEESIQESAPEGATMLHGAVADIVQPKHNIHGDDEEDMAEDESRDGSSSTHSSLPGNGSEDEDDASSNIGDNEVLSMRGGGLGECARSVVESQHEPAVVNSAEVSGETSKHSVISTAGGDQKNNGPTTVQSTNVGEDAHSLLQLSQAAVNTLTTILPTEKYSSGSQNGDKGQPEGSILAVGTTPASPSRLQNLINAVAKNEEAVGLTKSSETFLPKGATPLLNGQNISASTSSNLFTNEGALPSTPLSAPGSQDLSAKQTKSPTPKKPKKKVVPLSESQVNYLKDWLFDPSHILNPYPTDEEKNTIMKDIGIERKRLDGWFMKNRQRVLYPEVHPVKMKWNQQDSDHWTDFRKNRYMLEATADLLLMYARTNTFFLLEPFRQFDSTPIEVYARELGNEVPKRFAFSHQKSFGSTANSALPDMVDSSHDDHPMNDANSCNDEDIAADKTRKHSKKMKGNKKEGGLNNELLCPPEEVIDEVTVDYSGDYVLSQLLQWVNGGIGQKKGLPDIYGCVMLPPVVGCWEEIKCNEVKLPDYTRWNRKTTTEYDAKVRPKLAEWIADRYQRGSPWESELAKFFCPLNGAPPDPTMPMGSPVLDYLVTGIDENICHVSAALCGQPASTNGEARLTKLSSASDRLQSTVDEGMPAQAVANWVQCENPNCLKWRKLPWHVDVDLLPENFFCKDNQWNPKSQSCDASEDEWDMEDAPIKFDMNEENFEVGVWFDVQREGKVGFHEAQVVEVDFESNVKRVKFHFWKLSSDRDEWVEVGSPRIAPHHSYTPRPLDGYGASKNKKSTDKSKNPVNPSPDNALSTLPQKRKVDSLVSSKSSEPTEGAPDEPKKFAVFPQSTIDYLNTWISEHAANPFPSPEEKAQIVANTGLSKRQVGDWMARARKKLRKKSSEPDKETAPDRVQPISKPSTDVATINSVPNNAENVENLLLALRNQRLPQPVSRAGDSNQNGQGSTQSGQLAGKATTGKDSSHVIVPVNKAGVSAPTVGPGGDTHKTSIKELETYMKTWLSKPENAGCNLLPTLAQKEKIIQETGIEKKRLEGWFFRARKKLKKHHIQPSDISAIVQDTSSGEASTSQQHQPRAKPGTALRAQQKQPLVSSVTAPMAAKRPPTKSNPTISALPTSKTAQNLPVSSTTLGAGQTMFSPLTKAPPSVSTAGKTNQDLPTSLAQTGKMNAPISVKAATVPMSSSTSPHKGLTEQAKSYLTRWMSEHRSNPYPSREEKDEMMSVLGIGDARKLEGWFCRARKRQKQNSDSTNIPGSNTKEGKDSNRSMVSESQKDTLQPLPQVNEGEKTAQTPISSHGSSNFASLLSAAKSELGTNSRRSSPHLHVSNQVLEDDPRAQPEQIQNSSHNDSKHGFNPPVGERSYQNLGAREQAILSSFQSLQSMEIHDRSSRRASPADYSSYPHGQQQGGSADYSSYHHPHGQHRTYQYQQAKKQGSQAEYPTHQQPQTEQPTDHSSYHHSHGQRQSTQAEYAPHQNNYPTYQHSQGHQRPSSAAYSYYQQTEPQEQASSADYPYHHSNGQHQASSTDYPYYQHSEGQPEQGQGYVYPHPQESHQGHIPYGHQHNSTYQH